MKILPVRAELFYVARRVDTTKLVVTFRNFANALKNQRSQRGTEKLWKLQVGRRVRNFIELGN